MFHHTPPRSSSCRKTSRLPACGKPLERSKFKQTNRQGATHRNINGDSDATHKYGKSKGASLLIALGIITIITLLGIGIGSYVVSGLKDSANITRSVEAYYAAEGALEAGLLVNAQKGAGFSTNGLQPAYFGKFTECGANDNDCLARTPKFKIQGQVEEDKKYLGGNYVNYYSIPSPGTGTVGNNCDPIRAQIKETLYFNEIDGKYYSSQDIANTYIPVVPEENPCSWNKINSGESVSIPLYVTVNKQYMEAKNLNCNQVPGSVDSFLCNPKDLGLASLILRVRTPCATGKEMCSKGSRHTLNDQNQGDPIVGYNDVILDWQIQAENKDGNKSYVMVPFHDYDKFKGAYTPFDSEIYESRVNSIKPLEVNQNNGTFGIDISPSGKQKGMIFNFLNDLVPWNLVAGTIRTNAADAINKPVLKLTIVNKLINFVDKGPIPNLEYQILTNANISPSDSSQTVTAENFSGAFKQVLQTKNAQEGNQIQYVIEQ